MSLKKEQIMQQIFNDFSAFEVLKDKKPLLVCDDAFDYFGIELPCEYARFSGFKPNPLFEDIKAGVRVLRKNKCDFIVAIGGGSSIDTAKAIKYYSHVDLPLMAVPTTSGTGSEATHFAVIYKDGEKQSIAEKRLLPDYVILQPDTLKTLPIHQKKCTMLDALCQAVESWWSRKATPESIDYSKKAIKLILENIDSYLRNEDEGNKNMLIASNLAGKAINITTTTAPHAMSYKLTSLYNLPHGHAVALCLPKVWSYMKNFDEIAEAFGKQKSEEAVLFFEQLLQMLEIFTPINVSSNDIDTLTNSVNLQRLHNNPVRLDKDTIKALYKKILEV
jgi:alcohol dehydrogenase class IV